MKIPFTKFNISLKSYESSEVNQSSSAVYYGPKVGQAKNDKIGLNFDADTYFIVYENLADVNGCVRELRQSFGREGWHLMKDDEIDDGVATRTLDDLFNAFVGYNSLFDRAIRDWAVAGNAYWEIIKNEAGTKILGFKPIDPRTMYIVADSHGNVVRYLQKHGRDVVEFQADEVFHLVIDRDTRNECFGLSPMRPFLWEARTELAGMISNYYLIQNDSVPGAWFIMEDDVGEEEMKNFVESLKDNFQGADKTNKPSVLQGVKDIKMPRLSQKDLEYLQGRKFNTEKICAAYGVPKVMLGYTEGVNYSNAEQQHKKFIEDTIQPLEQQVADQLTRKLLPLIGLNEYRFMFNVHDLVDSDLKEERVMKKFMIGMITLNEAREELAMLPVNNPVADEHIIHSGMSAVTLDDVGVDPVADITAPENAEKSLSVLEKFINRRHIEDDTQPRKAGV